MLLDPTFVLRITDMTAEFQAAYAALGLAIGFSQWLPTEEVPGECSRRRRSLGPRRRAQRRARQAAADAPHRALAAALLLRLPESFLALHLRS